MRTNVSLVIFCLSAILVILILIFSFFVFKNIQHGLLWNDEGETAMYAKSIIQYGYPKIHYGKNVLNVSETKDLSVGVKENIDAWIYISSWGSYYLAVPAVKLAEGFSDPYLKTFILRFYFALFGFTGILIFAYIGSLWFNDITKKLLFVNLYLIFEILSIPLILHLRQVRHFPFAIFFLSLLFLILVKKVFLNSIKSNLFYQLFSFILLVVLMNVYFPAFLSYLIFIICVLIVRSRLLHSMEPVFKEGLYLVFIIVFLFVYFCFFEFFSVSRAISTEFGYDFKVFLSNFWIAVVYLFSRSEYLLVSCLFFVFFVTIFIKNNFWIYQKQFAFTLAILFYIFVSTIISSRIPYFFERYYIFLQPFLILFLVLNFLFVWDFFGSTIRGFSNRLFLAYIFFLLVIVNSVLKIDIIRGYLYELSNQYRGPLDYLVGYITKNYTDTDSLVIATNYEEHVLMYYLGSRVVIGYVGNNLEDDLRTLPDIIVIRKNRPNFVKELESFLSKGNYEKVVLDVYDYHVNNIPESTIPLKHLFATPTSVNEEEKLSLYVLKK